MKINNQIIVILILIIVFVSFAWYNNNRNESNSIGAFTPRFRAAVRPHLRTIHRGYGGILSVFSWDNWRRGLRRWNL